jgi:hemoglobin
MTLPTAKTHYESIGGDAAVRKLVDTFYDRMDESENYTTIRALHPADLTSSRDKLYKFLAGWLGGPPLYMNEFGHPRLRMRHAPFTIGITERDQWLACMTEAMDACAISGELRTVLDERLAHVANFMRNRED